LRLRLDWNLTNQKKENQSSVNFALIGPKSNPISISISSLIQTLALKIYNAHTCTTCCTQCNVYIRIFFQVEAIGSVKNINIKNKNIN